MKLYKLQRSFKVADMARNRSRKLRRLFQCANWEKSRTLLDLHNRMAMLAEEARKALSQVADWAALLVEWEEVKDMDDHEIFTRMKEALDCSITGRCGVAALPNHWLFVVQKHGPFSYDKSKPAYTTCELARHVVGPGRYPAGTGSVSICSLLKRSGPDGPKAVIARALQYAKEHPEDLK